MEPLVSARLYRERGPVQSTWQSLFLSCQPQLWSVVLCLRLTWSHGNGGTRLQLPASWGGGHPTPGPSSGSLQVVLSSCKSQEEVVSQVLRESGGNAGQYWPVLTWVQNAALPFGFSQWLSQPSSTWSHFLFAKAFFPCLTIIWLWCEITVWNPVLGKCWKSLSNSFRKAPCFSPGSSLQSFSLSVRDCTWSYFYMMSSVMWSQYCICRSKTYVCTYLKNIFGILMPRKALFLSPNVNEESRCFTD